MAPEKPRNDPQILTTPKIFDFYHQTLTLKFLYRGSTIYLIRTFLRNFPFQAHFEFRGKSSIESLNLSLLDPEPLIIQASFAFLISALSIYVLLSC